MTQLAALPLFAELSHWTVVGLPLTMALAAIALVGYVFGRRTRTLLATMDERRRRELDRAGRIACQLEAIAAGLQQDLLAHRTQVTAFKRRLRRALWHGHDELWDTLCREADAMLGPTMQLAHQLSHAYEQIRRQSDALETFTQGRTDPLTGVGNARALDQQLQVLLAGAARGNADFAVALVSLHSGGKLDQSERTNAPTQLPKLAGVIRQCLRGDTDFVARFGDDEFVILMPQTSLAGASVFGERLQNRVAEELDAAICCGITVAEKDDDARSLLARVDSALYSAKAAGGNRMFLHTGTHIREHHAGLFQSPAADAEFATHAPCDERSHDSAAQIEAEHDELVLHEAR